MQRLHVPLVLLIALLSLCCRSARQTTDASSPVTVSRSTQGTATSMPDDPARPAGEGTAPPRDATVLFDGTDLDRWVSESGKPIGWQVAQGALTVVPGSGSIMTRAPYGDFRIHLEFKVPRRPAGVQGQGRGNSGVYLQRRYEVQILDSFGEPAAIDGCGAIYRAKAPDENASLPAGTWQTYDIVFHQPRWTDVDGESRKTANAKLSVRQNGIPIHREVPIPNKTGLGQPEAPGPAPILLQDHGNAVSFRNIWIVPLNDS